MNNHTPGPWEVQSNGRIFAGKRSSGNLRIVAKVVPLIGEEVTDENLVANANLIAAAPDLLEVAEAVAASGLIPEWSALGQSARAAIAKARGEA